MKKYLLILVVYAMLFGLVACHSSTDQVSAQLAQSTKTRIFNPQVNSVDLKALTDGNTAFALNLYQLLHSQTGNLIFSPFSISEALAMTYAGAGSTTAEQMAAALHFTLPQDRLHPAFNELDQKLNSQVASDWGFKLNVVNALWGQQGFTFLPAFLDTLSQNYGAGMRLLDFKEAPDPARQAINDWVSSQTAQKIKDLLPQGSIIPTTRLVLTNAVYFKADWTDPFKVEDTQDLPFFLADGTQVSVQTMQQTVGLNYAESGNLQVVELPYASSSLSMVILLPKAGTLESFESAFDVSQLASLVKDMTPQQVTLSMPKFKFDASFDLTAALSALGMPDAFTSGKADFSGMDGQKDLLIQAVLHKAYIAVNEQGTEAAAATGVVVGLMAMPVGNTIIMNVDQPFMFLITDRSSGTILFMGRVMDPRN